MPENPMPAAVASRGRLTMGRVLLAALLTITAASLVGCAPGTDPGTTRESLSEVTEDPQQPDAAAEYDAEAHPDPIVEPLECTPYLVITARGTGEPSVGQLLSPVARAIAEARPDETQTLDVDYPADTDVQEGGTLGVRLVIDTLNVQTAYCPEQRFVLLGYSQGALVVGDALADPAVRLVGPTVGELLPDAADRVLAVVFYGDPRFVGSEAYDVGDYDPRLNGLLPRPPGSLEPFADRIRDYCVAGDLVCQSSLALDEEPHLAYYENGMQQDGAAFVITQLDPVGTDSTGLDGADRDGAPASGTDAADGR